MSISSELTRLNSVRDALVDSINAKGGTLPADATLWAVRDGVEAIEQGGGGAFDLVKVTEHTPYQAPFSGISKVTFSGFGVDDMSGNDYSYLNGDWAVENPDEPDPLKRSFVNGSNFLYYFPDPEYRVGGDAWCIGSNKNYGGHEAALYYNSTSELTNGTINWYSMMGGASCTCAVTKTNYPEVQFVLKGQKATEYDPASKVWTFNESIVNFSATEKKASVNGIFAATGGQLIGARICIDWGAFPSNGLVLFAPLDGQHATAETGQSLLYDGTFEFTEFAGVPCVNLKSGYIKTAETSGISGTQSRAFSFWAYPTGSQQYCNTVGIGNQANHGYLFNCGVRQEGGKIRRGFTAWGSDMDTECFALDNQWHHFVYMLDANSPRVVKGYVDGVEFTHSTDTLDTKLSPFFMGRSGAGDWYYTGYLASVRCYNRVLSLEEVNQLLTEHA